MASSHNHLPNDCPICKTRHGFRICTPQIETLLILVQFFCNSVEEVAYIMGEMYPSLNEQCVLYDCAFQNLLEVMSGHLRRRVFLEGKEGYQEGTQTCREIFEAGPRSDRAKAIGDRAKAIIREWRVNGEEPEIGFRHKMITFIGGTNNAMLWMSLVDPARNGTSD